MKFKIVYLLFGIVYFSDISVNGKLRRQPYNSTVLFGMNKTTECFFTDVAKAENLQWAKDGIVDNLQISGKYVNSEVKGYSILNHINISFEDEGFYSCQFGPFKSRDFYIEVIAPPKNVTILGAQDDKFYVRKGSDVDLECVATDSKPATTLIWKIDGRDVSHQSVHTEMQGSNKYLTTSVSTLHLRSDEVSSQKTIECISTSTYEKIKNVSFKASIDFLRPPDSIKVWKDVDKVVAGQLVEIYCDISGGNPKAKVVWKINQEEHTSGEMISTSSDFQRYKLSRVIEIDDVIECEASNAYLKKSFSEKLDLDILYAPDHVEVSSLDNEIFQGDSSSLKCSASSCNPQPSFKWFRIMYGSSELIEIERNERLSVSSTKGASFLTITGISLSDYQDKFVCQVSIPILNYTKQITKRLNVLFEPKSLKLQVYNSQHLLEPDFNYVSVNSLQNQRVFLLCYAEGGNPKPFFKWKINGVEIIKRIHQNFSAINPLVNEICKPEALNHCDVLEVDINKSNNRFSYQCEIVYKVKKQKKNSTSVVLDIKYPPEDLLLISNPELLSGQLATFTCTTSTFSNPKSEILWFLSGKQLTGIIEEKFEPDSNGGFKTISKLKFVPFFHHNGRNLSCRTEEKIFDLSMTKTLSLNVKFKPLFSTNNYISHVIEGKDVFIPIPVLSNPAPFKLEWFEIISDGPKQILVQKGKSRWNQTEKGLFFKNLTSSDNGNYQIKVTNIIGEGSFNFSLNVQYSAKITSLLSTLTVDENEDAFIECSAIANPIESLKIQWKRKNHETDIQVNRVNSTSSELILQNIHISDEGSYICTAKNDIGDETKKEFQLKVYRKPTIDRIRTPSKSAISISSNSRGLSCVAEGRPKVEFTWFDENGQAIEKESKINYVIRQKTISDKLYISTLYIKSSKARELLKTGKDSSRKLKCIASNKLGEDEIDINVVKMGSPDKPSHLAITNITLTSATVTWDTGFNGGANQTLFISLIPSINNNTDWIVLSRNTLSKKTYELLNLVSNTHYTVKMKSRNKFGFSGQSEPVTFTTKALSSYLMFNYAVFVAVGVVALVAICILTICIKRNKRSARLKKDITQSSSDVSSKGQDSQKSFDVNKPPAPVETFLTSSQVCKEQQEQWRRNRMSVQHPDKLSRSLSATSFNQGSFEIDEALENPVSRICFNKWQGDPLAAGYSNSVRGFSTLKAMKPHDRYSCHGEVPSFDSQLTNVVPEIPNQYQAPVCLVDGYNDINTATLRQNNLKSWAEQASTSFAEKRFAIPNVNRNDVFYEGGQEAIEMSQNPQYLYNIDTYNTTATRPATMNAWSPDTIARPSTEVYYKFNQPQNSTRWSQSSRSDERSQSVTSSNASSTRLLLPNNKTKLFEQPSPPLRFRDNPSVALHQNNQMFVRIRNEEVEDASLV